MNIKLDPFIKKMRGMTNRNIVYWSNESIIAMMYEVGNNCKSDEAREVIEKMATALNKVEREVSKEAGVV